MAQDNSPLQADVRPVQQPMAGYQQPVMDDEEESINISDFFSLCMRCWKWFAFSVFVCLCIGALYVLSAPKIYTRSAQVMVQDDDAKPSGVAAALSDVGLFTTPTNVANELLAFQSPALIGDVIERLDLRANYVYRKGLRPVSLYGDSLVLDVVFPDVTNTQGVSMKMKIAGDKVEVSDMRFNKIESDDKIAVALGDTVKTIAGRMIINAGPNYRKDFDETINFSFKSMSASIADYQAKLTEALSNDDATVIDFTIKDDNVQRADDFLTTIIDIYNEKWVDQKEQMAVATSNFINERLNVIEKELGHVDSDIAAYKSEHLVPDVQAASEMYMANANENTKRQLDVQTQIDITRYLLEYMQAPENRGKLLPANLGIENQGIASQITEYNNLQLERDQLLTSTGENSPLVKDRDSSLASIKAALASSLRTQVKMLQTQLSALVRSDRTTNAKIASSPSQGKYLLSVERQQKVKESLYLFLLQKREENELSLAFTPYNTRTITPPMGPSLPTSPVTRNVLLIAIVIGLLIPAVVLFLSETLNNRIRSRDDLVNVRAPFIGEIPEEVSSKSRINRWRRRWRDNVGKESRIEDAPTLLVKPHGHSIINESFRMVRSNLEFMTRNGKNKIAMVTSFNPGSGKSFVALNLGSAMAIKRKGARVLVIDLDLRRASLSKVVGNQAPGVSDYLSEATDNIDQLVRTTDQEGLYMIPVGTIPPNPSELLYSSRLQHMLDKLRAEYDFIILDCPPSDIVADATIITPLADMTVFVVRAGLLDRRLLPELNRMYETHRFNNLMVLLNGTTSIAAPYRRYAYSNYYTNIVVVR